MQGIHCGGLDAPIVVKSNIIKSEIVQDNKDDVWGLLILCLFGSYE